MSEHTALEPSVVSIPLVFRSNLLQPDGGDDVLLVPSELKMMTHITRSPEEIAVFVFHVKDGVQLVLLLVALTAVARRTVVGKAMRLS